MMLSLRLLLLIAITATAACASAAPRRTIFATPYAPDRLGNGDLAERLLIAHNRTRAEVGAPPLRWDPALAVAAASYGPALAALGTLRHSAKTERPGQSENLWMGTRGFYSPEQMVGSWVSERAYFRPGPFPAVSSTGNWADVGHYTQMIWPTTTSVGCAVQRTGQWDFLICRYAPKGNIDGVRLP